MKAFRPGHYWGNPFAKRIEDSGLTTTVEMDLRVDELGEVIAGRNTQLVFLFFELFIDLDDQFVVIVLEIVVDKTAKAFSEFLGDVALDLTDSIDFHFG